MVILDLQAVHDHYMQGEMGFVLDCLGVNNHNVSNTHLP